MVIIRKKKNYNYFLLHKIKQRIAKTIFDYKITIDKLLFNIETHKDFQNL